jgi:manganese/zinc/iron transport system permease protein
MPELAAILQVLTLHDYNTRLVVLGVGLLGMAAGLIGSFTLLRKRALMGDALSHATLPGIGLAFILAGATEKSLPVLLAGATVTSVLGVGLILFISHFTRLKEDTALGVTIGVFFGAGIAVLGVVQQMGSGAAAGLEAFIYGKTASMIDTDVWLIIAASAIVVLVCILLFKEFKLLCFDSAYAKGQGWLVGLLDVAMMGLVVVVTVIGLQAVGLILIIALLIIPAAAARCWVERLLPMTILAALLGGISAMLGAAASALLPKLPSGPMIVLVAVGAFTLSMLLGPARGVVPRQLRRYRLKRRVERQRLLRALHEISEAQLNGDRRAARPAVGARPRGDRERQPWATQTPGVEFDELLKWRSWSASNLRRALRRAQRARMVQPREGRHWALTEEGECEAAQVARNHRLWELYLITHADIAPGHVDRDADMIEHVLPPELIARLEQLAELDSRRMAEPVIP